MPALEVTVNEAFYSSDIEGLKINRKSNFTANISIAEVYTTVVYKHILESSHMQ